MEAITNPTPLRPQTPFKPHSKGPSLVENDKKQPKKGIQINETTS